MAYLPSMKKYKSIYVAASRQHVGKTTSTLGLVSCLMERGLQVGYCKPVGQKYVDLSDIRVDKDAILFADLIHFDIQPAVHSPVILGDGATTKFLDNPDQEGLRNMIIEARDKLESSNEIAIFEGTGHPGVGSLAGVSNAQVARMVDASVIFIVEGGIGSTIDMLNMCLALFREEKVPILGVIVNKVHQDKMEKVRHYLSKYLDGVGIPLLGLLPYDKTLAYPVMRTVSKAVQGTVTANPHKLDNKVADIVAGSLIDFGKLEELKDLLLVVSARQVNDSIRKIKHFSVEQGLETSPLSGVVATGKGSIDDHCLDYVNRHEIPLIRTELDTYGCVIKISRIEVKINRNTPWKVKRAIELIEENVDLDFIIDRMRLS